MNKITIPRWFDRHLHLRDGDMLKTVLPYTLAQCATGAVVMGNLKHPDETSTIAKTTAYHDRIMKLLPRWSDFNLYMTCYLTDEITPEEVVRGFKEAVWVGVKGYLADQRGKGGTTNSGHGVKNIRGRYPVFAKMEREGIPYLGHFEAVEEDVDEFDREAVSLERDLIPMLKAFPGLTVVVEHVTDGRMADFVAETEHNVYATVTAHHLMLNRNAMFWGGMSPLYYCKPVPKEEFHRLKVRKYVTSGHPRFGAGTDSAPHPEDVKTRSSGCAAGIFTAPVAVELYTTVFDEDNALQHLSPFLSENFLRVYGTGLTKEKMILAKMPCEVPEKVESINVFKGGTILSWTLIG